MTNLLNNRFSLYSFLALTIGSIYTATMAPTIYAFDSSELTTAAYVLGVVHAPGYAVYLLVAHLFTYLPIGDIGYRVNWLSAVSTIAASLILADILWRLTQNHTVAIIVTVFTFCFSFYVWTLSVIAEVYTFQVLLLGLMIWTTYRWTENRQKSYLKATAFIMGLAAINNPSTVLWWPGIFIWCWLTPNRKELTIKDYLHCIGFGCLGLLPILYYPLRTVAAPPMWYAGFYDGTAAFQPLDLRFPTNIIWYLSGRQFESYIFGHQFSELPGQTRDFIYRLWGAFLGIGLPLGLYGIWKMSQSKRFLTIGLLVIALSHGLFFIAYRAGDKETMFLPVYFVWAIFIGYAIFASTDLSPYFAPLSLALPLCLTFVNLPYVDVNDYYGVAIEAETRLTELPPNAIYVASWGDASAMEYQQIINKQRADVQVINLFLVSPENQAKIAEMALAENQPIYYSYRDTVLIKDYFFKPTEIGYQLNTRN